MKILLIVYDNDSYITWFPLGLAYISSVMKKAGHNVKVYSQDMYHYPKEHLTGYIDQTKPDVVCVSVIAGYYQYKKLLEISSAIHASKHKPIYILGGRGPSPEPEYFLQKTGADYIVHGEGEITIKELLENLDKNSAKYIKGISYYDGDKFVKTADRPLIKDIDNIDYPDWDSFPIDYYVLSRQPGIKNTARLMTVLSGRGCLFKCNFCYRGDKGFRPRSIDSIIDELKLLKQRYWINAIDFSDELLMSSIDRTVELSEAMIKAGLNMQWACNGRLNYASMDRGLDMLRLMKKAGCTFINYGIESFDNESLRKMNKCLNETQIVKGVDNTLKAEIVPGLNIIFGNIDEDQHVLKKGVEFLKKYNVGNNIQYRTIRPVTPYPGSPLYYYAIEKGLLKDVAEFYEKKHINSDLLAVNFTKLSDEDFYKYLKEANLELVEDYYNKKIESDKLFLNEFYDKKMVGWRGFRQT